MSEREGWRVCFRYNGRLDGGNQTKERLLPRDASGSDCLIVIEELKMEALRENGVIFTNGWSVDWVEDA